MDTFSNLTLEESLLYTNDIGTSGNCDEGTVLWTVVLKDKKVLKLKQQLVSYSIRGSNHEQMG